jgi:hypothetical protein
VFFTESVRPFAEDILRLAGSAATRGHGALDGACRPMHYQNSLAAEGSTVAALPRTLGQLQTQQAIEETGEQLPRLELGWVFEPLREDPRTPIIMRPAGVDESIPSEVDTSVTPRSVNSLTVCCASRLGRGNSKRRTHSETSSNYLCANGGLEAGGMAPSRARGRPRSEERRDAVLTAAMELMQEDDLRRASFARSIYSDLPRRVDVR